MITYADIKGFLHICRCTCEVENEHSNVWRKPDGDYITFWSDDPTYTVFTLKRILEKLGKDVTDFNVFMEAKYSRKFNVILDGVRAGVETELAVEVEAIPAENGTKRYQHALVYQATNNLLE